jgi:hypothetical protein
MPGNDTATPINEPVQRPLDCVEIWTPRTDKIGAESDGSQQVQDGDKELANGAGRRGFWCTNRVPLGIISLWQCVCNDGSDDVDSEIKNHADLLRSLVSLLSWAENLGDRQDGQESARRHFHL